MDVAKFRTFLQVARALNGIGITPLLAGSLGLELVTGRDWSPSDLDVWVPGDPRGWAAPDDERIHDWPAIRAALEGLGFRLVDLHEHALVDDTGHRLEIGDLDELPSFADVPLDSLAAHETDGARYLLLTLEQYLALYEASLLDGYRADGEQHKDQAKVDHLRQRVGRPAR